MKSVTRYQIWRLYIIFEAINEENLLWLILGCKADQGDPTVMELQLDVWHCLLDVYTKFQIDISKHVEKSQENCSLAGSSTNSPSECFCPPEGQKLPNHDDNQ